MVVLSLHSENNCLREVWCFIRRPLGGTCTVSEARGRAWVRCFTIIFVCFKFSLSPFFTANMFTIPSALGSSPGPSLTGCKQLY
ncbi:transmembrane protein, putative [Medicago truncatula]|uniref:Transmembrane protein, putative n=1 Tax=Medicago truncatula TaxID=3880 RepID=A0A072UZN3_MEDTR|nr:transmembrane protein, putative [Medicago truncatula]